jgi:DNA polymerase-4/DNA polymerase V
MNKESSKEFPRAILHFDGDSFFASVEQAMDYRLRGKPIVTGAERGAVTALSQEAKMRGLSRGMRLSEIRIRCPEAIVVTSDYVSYALFAHRMYSIVRSHAPIVEEYSIDECFADITGLDEQFGISYEEIALRIKAELEDSLGITFGAGLAPTKTLAKIASKAHKPAGFTRIPLSAIPKFLENMSIYNVWGLGGASGTKLTNLGAETALKFAQKSDAWLAEHRLGKAYRDIWLELNGHFIKTLTLESDGSVGSIMTTRMFKPPSMSRSYIFSQLSKNVERVCEKARHANVQAKGLTFFLKTQEFTYHSVSIEFTVPIANPSEILKLIEDRFDEVYAEGILYRASGITLRSLVSNRAQMPDLFGATTELERKGKSFEAIDGLNVRYGKQTVFLASSLQAAEQLARSKNLSRRTSLALGLEKKRKTLNVPYLGITH